MTASYKFNVNVSVCLGTQCYLEHPLLVGTHVPKPSCNYTQDYLTKGNCQNLPSYLTVHVVQYFKKAVNESYIVGLILKALVETLIRYLVKKKKYFL